jgi:hypothetical protein
VSLVRYELGFYIPEHDILHSHRHEHLKSYAFIFNYVCLVPASGVHVMKCEASNSTERLGVHLAL